MLSSDDACQQGASGHVPVGDFAEQPGRGPFPVLEGGLQHHHLAPGLGVGRKPDGQQLSARHPRDGRLVVMGIERGEGIFRLDDIGKRLHENRFMDGMTPFSPGSSVAEQGPAKDIGPLVTFHHPESQQDGAVGLHGSRPVGAPEIPHRSVVATPADDAEFSVAIIIKAPLLHIPVHVIQSPRIGLELSHLQGDVLLVTGVLLHLPLAFRERVARVVGGRGSRPAGVLPFLLGGKTVVFTGLLGKPSAVGHGIVPRHHDYRLVISHGEALLASLVRRVERLVLRVGDFRRAHPERIDLHLPPRRLVPVFHGRMVRPHPERPCRDVHHPGEGQCLEGQRKNQRDCHSERSEGI